MRNNGLLSFWPLELSRYQVHNHIEDVVFTNFAECSLLFFQNFKCRHELIKMPFQDMNGHVVSASFVQSDQTFIDIQIEWTLLPSKLTHPLRIDEWKMKFPCKMVPFQVVYSFFFFGGVGDSPCNPQQIQVQQSRVAPSLKANPKPEDASSNSNPS